MSFDAWKEDAPELDSEPAMPCCVCSGDENAPPCSPECEHAIDVVKVQRSVRHLYAACRRALRLARQYRDEGRVRGRKSRRLDAVMQTVAVWREDIRLIRAEQRKKAA